MRVKEQRYKSSSPWEMHPNRTRAGAKHDRGPNLDPGMALSLCPHGLPGEVPLSPKWLSPSLVMVVLPRGDPGLKETGPFPTAMP